MEEYSVNKRPSLIQELSKAGSFREYKNVMCNSGIKHISKENFHGWKHQFKIIDITGMNHQISNSYQ